MSVFQVFYVSRAARPSTMPGAGDPAGLAPQQRAARHHRLPALFGRCFAQVLEGAEPAAIALSRKIAADPRHGGVRFLSEAHGDQRDYADWSMGYLHDLNLEDDLETLLMIPTARRWSSPR